MLQNTRKAQPHHPKALFNCMKIEMAAKTHRGSKLYPKILMHVINSTYYPFGDNKLIISDIAIHPVSPNP